MSDLIERLLRTYTHYHFAPSSTVATVPIGHVELLAREVLVNPDGIEAAEAITAKDADIARLREVLERLRDCDWVITPLDRMDAVRDIARQALTTGQIETSGFADCEASHVA